MYYIVKLLIEHSFIYFVLFIFPSFCIFFTLILSTLQVYNQNATEWFIFNLFNCSFVIYEKKKKKQQQQTKKTYFSFIP